MWHLGPCKAKLPADPPLAEAEVEPQRGTDSMPRYDARPKQQLTIVTKHAA